MLVALQYIATRRCTTACGVPVKSRAYHDTSPVEHAAIFPGIVIRSPFSDIFFALGGFRVSLTSFIYDSRKTIGVDFGVKQVKMPETDCVVELFLFDCPGQGVFNKLEQVSENLGVCTCRRSINCPPIFLPRDHLPRDHQCRRITRT